MSKFSEAGKRLCFASACYGGTQRQKVSELIGVKNHLQLGCSWGSDAIMPLQSAPPKVFGLPFLLLKSMPDLLIASKWVVLSVWL